MIRRLALIGTLAAALLSTLAPPASADPAGPTDFQNEILRVEPTADAVAFSVVGGDSFLRAEVRPGTELVVLGYFGEPYLRILPDGTVEENVVSPSVVLNEDRYGTSTAYDRDDAQLPPEWQVVGSAGTWAWHDHRIHWMAESPPPGRTPGDLVFDEVTVPVLVDGTPTKVYVSLSWLERPPPLAALAGILAGIGAAVALRRHRHHLLLGTAVLALGVGVRQWAWLPPETTPSILQWAVPGIAVVFAIIGLRRPVMAPVAGSIAAVELAAWGAWRWESMVRAVLPTAEPWALDRFVTALALSVGAAVLGFLVAARVAAVREPAP